MKRYTLTLALMMILPVFSAGAYESGGGERAYYSSSYRPTNTNAYYKQKQAGNNYYNNSSNQARSVNAYTAANRQPIMEEERSYTTVTKTPEVKTTKVSETKTTKMRKYFLAHPFFQPLKNDFGSVTDFSYAQNEFKFDILDGYVTTGLNPNSGSVYGYLSQILSGKQKSTQFTVKEDLSFGISDTLAVIGMVQYDKTKVSVDDWSDGAVADSVSDSGINVYGIGLQYRFVDNSKWLGMFDLLFQHQNDAANTLIGEIQGGYKINRTTIYGLGRLWYSSLMNSDSYGAFIPDGTGNWLMLSYNTNVNSLFNVEGGLGVYSVLNKEFTLNGEVVYGHYDWHDQMNIKGAIAWQPGDYFALNLYASTSFYDSAKNKMKQYMYYNSHPDNPADYPKDTDGVTPLLTGSSTLYTVGGYKIRSYNEWKIGLQAIFRF